MGEEIAEICVQRFLNWYNQQRRGDHIHQRASTYFPDLKSELNWDFLAYERDNLKEWIGIEVKELSTMRQVSSWFDFWGELCSELTQDLAAKGIQGDFELIHPPPFYLKSRERPKFRKAFVEVITDKGLNLGVDTTDIGPDIAFKYNNWPREESRNSDQWDKWGKYRPCELLISKSADSGCEVSSPISPIRARDGVEQHRETFGQANIEHANEQLKLAKEKGAEETILLFACGAFIYKDLIKDEVQNLDSHLISAIDCIYLVDMGSGDEVVKVYPLNEQIS